MKNPKWEDDFEEEVFEEEGLKKKKNTLYSPLGKIIVIALFLISVAFASFGIIQMIVLYQSGLSPVSTVRGNAFEETALCTDSVTQRIGQISGYYRDSNLFGTKGEYDGEKEFDFWTYYDKGIGGIANDSTTYTVDQLAEMAENTTTNLPEYIDIAVYSYASNDAGIDKAKYQLYQQYGDDYIDQESFDDTTESGETTDNATTEESENQARREEEFVRFEQFDPDNDIWVPNDRVVQKLTEDGYDPKDFTSQFLYLYEKGMETEKQTTKAGTYLYEYAAANPKTVSLMDLYHALYQVSQELYQYRARADERKDGPSNVWYCVELPDGTVYTNVDAWKSGYNSAVAQKNDYQLALAYERKNDIPLFRSIMDEKKNSQGVTRLKNYFTSYNILDGNEKAVIALDPQLAENDILSRYAEIYNTWKQVMPLLIVMAAAGVLGTVICLILVGVQAGRNPWNRKIHLYGIDKFPTEVAAAIAVGILSGAIGMGVLGMALGYDTASRDAYYYGSYQYLSADAWRAVVSAAGIAVGGALFLIVYCSLIRRIRGKNLWKQSLLHGIVRMCREIYSARKKSERLLLLFVGFCLLQIFLNLAFAGFGAFLCIILDLLVLLFLLRESAGRQNIKEGLLQIGGGDLGYKINTDMLRGDNLEMAEAVNAVGEGLQAAVQEQMKSERLKADLITNVSHDIKTPLTSIINYVDLLKREQIEDPKIKGYIDVLDAKSQRLKQLTEDLVEASKISSGNIKLEFMNLNLNELVQQVNGEFDERFHTRGLELICLLQPEPLVIRADSRRIWRVLENLYVNVAKYAMPGTRVYVDAVRRDGKVMFSIKNISENALNFDANELTERFIRGDVSRSTEGSGLGLSIAKNLTVLQHGSFDVYLDGDLFKVTLTFDEVLPEQKKQNFWRKPEAAETEHLPQES